MKLSQFVAHFGTTLRIPVATLAGILLGLRQGNSKLALEERRLAVAARKLGYVPFDWDGRSFADFLRGESGRNGGITMSPLVAAFFLTAFLASSPNSTVAERTLRMFYAPVVGHWRFWDWGAPETTAAVCPVTKARYWGGALIAVLSDPALLDKVDELHMSDCDLAVLEFIGGAGTHFSPALRDKTGSYSMHNLPMFAVRPLLNLMMNEEAESPSSAA